MGELRETIEKKIAENDWTGLEELIADFSKRYPKDLNTILFRMKLALAKGNTDMAYKLAAKGVAEYPLHEELLGYMGILCEEKGEMFPALYYLNRSLRLGSFTRGEENALIDAEIKKVLAQIDAYSQTITSEEDMKALSELIDAYMSLDTRKFDLYDSFYRNMSTSIGTMYYENYTSRKYIGSFKEQFQVQYGNDECFNMLTMKGEFVPVVKDHCFYVEGNTPAADYLLPVAASEKDTAHIFTDTEGNRYECHQKNYRQFNYYKVSADTRVQSSTDCFYGRPIPMYHDPNRKKLVLNIFVDGLAGVLLQDSLFEENMPYTYEKFKKGIIFDAAYATGEWTYPCIATYVTGLDTTHHMLFHSMWEGKMPEDVPTLAESFHDAGYFTSNIGGNWRIVPAYGHARGYDRFIYQHQKVGFKVQEVIAEAINNIEAFRDTDHFSWISIGDLHDIADNDELPTCVQRQMDLTEREFEIDSQEKTSAKQGYSERKRSMYLKELRHIDQWLHILYQYLEEHYSEDEVVLSVFSDHGQGYMVKDDVHFLAKGRSHVAFMYAGGGVPSLGRIKDITSIADYSCIMRKLCDIPQPEVSTDGLVPAALGGEIERVFAITDSIHPNDPYQAALNLPGATFYFVNPVPVILDGRFELGDYTYWLENEQGERFTDEALEAECLDIILEHIGKLIIH